MKYRESGMPSEIMWDKFFNPSEVLNLMDINKKIGTLVDIGCGYGTFLFPISEVIGTKVIGIDIDEEMIKTCKKKVNKDNVAKIELIHGDVSTEDTKKVLDQYKGQIDYVTLFNILHCEEPAELLKNVYDMLKFDGRIGVTHWKYEETPRGPSMEIRPKPEMIVNWATKAGFILEKQIELPPYHYGLLFNKKYAKGEIK